MDDSFVLLGPILLLAHFSLWWWAAHIVLGRRALTLLAVHMMGWGLPVGIAGSLAVSRCCTAFPFLPCLGFGGCGRGNLGRCSVAVGTVG
jgi:hypothetical protein